MRDRKAKKFGLAIERVGDQELVSGHFRDFDELSAATKAWDLDFVPSRRSPELRAKRPARRCAGIADVANRLGFWHMGQFAADYRRLFGELPSDTKRRGLAPGPADPSPLARAERDQSRP